MSSPHPADTIISIDDSSQQKEKKEDSYSIFSEV